MARSTPQLKEVLAFRDVACLCIVLVFGYRQIVQAAAMGPTIISLLILAFFIFFIPQALTVARLSRQFPQEGGLYVWTKNAFGEFHGFICAWMYWTSALAFFPALLFFAAGSAAAITPESAGLAENKLFITLFSLVALALCLGVNLVGLDVARIFNNVGSLLSMWLPAALTILIGLIVGWQFGTATDFSAQNFIPRMNGADDVMLIAVLMYAFSGFDGAALLNGEIRSPQKSIPLAILTSGIFILLAYLGIAFFLLVLLSPETITGLTGSTEALKRAGELLGGPRLGTALGAVMGILLSLGTVAALSAWLGVTARLPFVVGLDQYLPPAFGKLHLKWKTPYVSLITLTAISSCFIILSGLGGRAEQLYELFVSLEIITFFIPYLYLFAAFIGLQQRASSMVIGGMGFLVTLGSVGLSCIPSTEVENVQAHFGTILGAVAINLVVGMTVYLFGRANYRRP